jgi:glycolate oxidase iron-sulfur subunit
MPSLFAYHRLARGLGRPTRALPETYSPGGSGEQIDLFVGCIAQSAQPAAVQAAHRVLEQIGFKVRVPRDQRCCGAMHRHNGFPNEADRLLARNADATSGHTVVGLASACVAELRTHPDLGGAREICRFLAERPWPAPLSLRPLTARIAVHEPCSQRNLLRDGRAAYDLLQRIPCVHLLALEDNAFCCGAAGTYLLQQPIVSRTLLVPKLQSLARLGVDMLVTTNTGCALHLAAGAREAGLALEVLHPVELIARQLRG